MPPREDSSEVRDIFQQTFEYCPEGLLVCDQAGKILQCNHRIEEMFGHSRDSLLGHSPQILFPERFWKTYLARLGEFAVIDDVPANEKHLESMGRRKDGSEFPVDITLALLITANGRMVLSAIRDVTEKVQEAFHLAEQPFRLLIESAQDYAIFLMDPTGKVITWNPGAERLKGYSAEEIIGRPFAIFYPPADIDQRLPERALQIAAEEGRFETEGWRLRKDGSRFWATALITRVQDDAGKLLGFAKVTRDFTKRMEAHRVLQHDEQEMRLLFNLAPDVIVVVDSKGQIVQANSQLEGQLGYAQTEVRGWPFLRLVPGHLRSKLDSYREMVLNGSEHPVTGQGMEIFVERKDGTKFPAELMLNLIELDGKPVALAVMRDITKRKRAEEALHRSEERLRTLFEFSPDAITVSDQNGTIRSVNAQAEKFFGYRRDELIGQSIELLVPERARKAHPAHRRHYAERANTRPMGLGLDLYGRRKDGSEFPIDIMLATLETDEGRVVMSTIRDISERRQAELALHRAQLEKSHLQEELSTKFDTIIGASTGLKDVLRQVETVAPLNATVLILGETGTGKELAARSIHDLSRRRVKPFIKLNCAAIPSGLLESELFGHEKGAFTGAISQKIGRLELADQGSLFLDEVGDIPLELQPKLLRALQEKQFERLGGTRTISVDVRLIAATNRDLEGMVAEKQFRSDLYYRLKVFPIKLPALRDRPEDIPLLVRYFVDMHARNMDKHIETIPDEVMEALERWRWPGNVRELENFLERAVILTPGRALYAPLAELQSPHNSVAHNEETLEATEREHVLRVLRESKGLIGGPEGAAKRLGVKRTTLNSKMKKLGIDRKDYT